jgi:hypothetical protein
MEEILSIQQRTRQRLEADQKPIKGFPVRVHLISFEPAPSEREPSD